MTSEEKNTIAKLYFEIGELHGRNLNKETLITLVNTFNDLSFNQVRSVMLDWFKNGSHFPLPAHIRQKINPTLNERDVAIDAVNAAIACVSQFGWTNADKARERMGELAWETVNRFGGWEHLCQSLTIENEGMFRAQLRELAQVVYKKSIRGELNETQSLPESNQIKNLVNNSIKSPG